MARAKSLAASLSGQPWVCRTEPFRHYVTRELFKPDVADAMSVAVTEAIADRDALFRFGHYDATTANLSDHRTWPLSLFTSRDWLDLVAGVTGVKATDHLAGGVHHHDIGGLSGSVHCDFNPAYFQDIPPEDGVIVSDTDLVDYTAGTIHKRGLKRTRVVRAVAILYYAGNDGWSPGDGGETGLYRRITDPVPKPVAVVPPRNNTLLVFECTPYSYHSYLTNRVRERNSVVMWLHRSFDDATAAWDESRLEDWL